MFDASQLTKHNMRQTQFIRNIMLNPSLDTIDLRILRELQNNSNISNVELARRINLSPSPTLARVKNLESSGVISRYVALVNPAALGLQLTVFVKVSLDKQVSAALKRFETEIAQFDQVMETYLMTGDEDYLLRVVVPNLPALERFIHHLTKIPHVSNIRSSFALKQVKYQTALPIQE